MEYILKSKKMYEEEKNKRICNNDNMFNNEDIKRVIEMVEIDIIGYNNTIRVI